MSSTMPSADGAPVIVTDSTCDLPSELYTHYGIELVPLRIMFGTESYRSGIDMQLAEFVERLDRGDVHPTSSQPTVSDFVAQYRALAPQGRPILSIHISEGLSGTVNAARQAVQTVSKEFPELAITVWDSGTISAALGLQVLTAARAAAAGYRVEQILPLLEQTHRDANLLFTLDDLSYLVRGGRIGAVRYHVAQTLKIKPVITVSKSGDTAGTYVSAGRVRSLEKAVGTFVKQVVNDVGEGNPVRAMAFYGTGRTPELAEAIGAQLREQLDLVYWASAPSTPVLGVHVGPLALDIGYAAGDWPV